jgi:hypothetical protein
MGSGASRPRQASQPVPPVRTQPPRFQHVSQSTQNSQNTSTQSQQTPRFQNIPSRPRRPPPQLHRSPSNSKLYPKCVVCQDQASNVALDPCGHLCLCESCLVQVAHYSAQCPICRSHIAKPMRVYIPGSEADNNPVQEDKSLQTTLPRIPENVVDFSKTI